LEPLSYVISMERVFCPDRIAHLPSNPLNVSNALSELPSAAEEASIKKSRKPTLRKIILNSFFRHLSRNLLPDVRVFVGAFLERLGSIDPGCSSICEDLLQAGCAVADTTEQEQIRPKEVKRHIRPEGAG
jgi:hypothetical protein